MVLDIRW